MLTVKTYGISNARYTVTELLRYKHNLYNFTVTDVETHVGPIRHKHNVSSLKLVFRSLSFVSLSWGGHIST